MKTALIHSDAATRFDYGPQHPLRMERLGLTWRLMQAYGITRLPGSTVLAPEPAAESDIARYHAREYLDVLKRANAGTEPPDGAMYGLGLGDNPVFRGLWESAQLVAAGSLLAADVVVAQLGVDTHRTDPLTHLALDVQGFAEALRRILPLAPRLVALGGGGYDLRNVARMWTVAWAVLNGVDLPDTLPPAFEDDARHHGFKTRSLFDADVALPDDLRRAVADYADRQIDAVQRTIFPIHGM
jgi:acetoin utilization deacetylase AcuC-like enzyme